MNELLAIHRAELERARTETNLVGPGPLDEHYLDAEAGLSDLSPSGRWADLGSGAGFPGIVLAALHPELAVDLIEPRRLRASFLSGVLLAAGSPSRIQVVQRRVQSVREHYDGATARALAPPAEVLALAAPILRPGATLVLFLQEDQPVSVDRRYRLIGEVRYAVPHRAPRRTLRLERLGPAPGGRDEPSR